MTKILTDAADIDSLFDQTGDSKLLSCTLIDGKLKIYLELDDGRLVHLEIAEEFFYVKNFVKNDINSFGRAYYEKISDYLDDHNGYYVFPDEFSKIMKFSKKMMNLVIGRNKNKYKRMFYYEGYGILIAFPFCSVCDFNILIDE